MGFYRYGAYIFSDDFERFHHLVVGNRMSIVYTSAKEKGRLMTATPANVDSQRFSMYRRFTSEQWLFIDPMTQHNPDTEAIVKKTSLVRWGDYLIPDMTVFNRIKGLLKEANDNFGKPIY